MKSNFTFKEVFLAQWTKERFVSGLKIDMCASLFWALVVLMTNTTVTGEPQTLGYFIAFVILFCTALGWMTVLYNTVKALIYSVMCGLIVYMIRSDKAEPQHVDKAKDLYRKMLEN